MKNSEAGTRAIRTDFAAGGKNNQPRAGFAGLLFERRDRLVQSGQLFRGFVLLVENVGQRKRVAFDAAQQVFGIDGQINGWCQFAQICILGGRTAADNNQIWRQRIDRFVAGSNSEPTFGTDFCA